MLETIAWHSVAFVITCGILWAILDWLDKRGVFHIHWGDPHE